jgi:hypothetical protein
MTDSRIRAGFDRPASGGVVFENIFQPGNAAVVHIRRGDRNVPEGGRLELANIPSRFCVLIRA